MSIETIDHQPKRDKHFSTLTAHKNTTEYYAFINREHYWKLSKSTYESIPNPFNSSVYIFELWTRHVRRAQLTR